MRRVLLQRALRIARRRRRGPGVRVGIPPEQRLLRTNGGPGASRWSIGWKRTAPQPRALTPGARLRARGLNEPQHHHEVEPRAHERQRVEQLVVPEHAGPQVRPLQGVRDGPQRVGDSTRQDE